MQLCYDVLVIIFRQLDWISLSKCRQVCRLRQEVAESSSVINHAFKVIHPIRVERSQPDLLTIVYSSSLGFPLSFSLQHKHFAHKAIPPVWEWTRDVFLHQDKTDTLEHAAALYLLGRQPRPALRAPEAPFDCLTTTYRRLVCKNYRPLTSCPF